MGPNNYFAPYGFGGAGYTVAQPGMAFNTPAPNMPMRQILTPDEQQFLKENYGNRDGFYNPPDKREEIASRCVHKFPDGRIALSGPDANGEVECGVCHERFHLYEPTEVSQEEVEKHFKVTNDLLQTIKTYKGDIDPEIGRSIYPYNTILKQGGKMWKNAVAYITRMGATSFSGYNTGMTPSALYSTIAAGGYVYPNNGQMYPYPVDANGYPIQQPVQPQASFMPPVNPQAAYAPQYPQQMPQTPVAPPQYQAQVPVQPQVQPQVAPPYGYNPNVIPGYTPYGMAPATPAAAPAYQQSANPIGHVQQAQQMVAPQEPAAPAAAPKTNVRVSVKSPDEEPFKG